MSTCTELSLNNYTLSSGSKFFAPVDTSQVEILFNQYKTQKDKIINMFEHVSGDDNSHTLEYFTNSRWDGHRGTHFQPSRVFILEHAIAYLDATFWRMAMNLTDVYTHMPSKDRDAWDEMISEHKTLPFDEEVVIDTLRALLNNREVYLSQRVQDCFEGLSGEHVTNSPQGFNKKMIFGTGRSGLLNDLRSVIARFSNRAPTEYGTTEKLINSMYANGDTGKWYDVDGGAMKLRVYLKGTKHLEVHEDICWRLNEILAINNPKAIPSEFRKKPKKKYKEFDYNQNLISFEVLNRLSDVKKALDYENGNRYTGYKYKPNCFTCFSSCSDKHTTQKVADIMIAMGGVSTSGSRALSDFQFDYNFLEVIPEILRTGSLPDKKSHQFYPTKPDLGKVASDWLDIQDGDACCEPSAGQGGLLDFMPKDTTAIEISPLQCTVLELRGYTNVICDDFINYASKTNARFDKILMNPPFSQKRHEQHLHTAMNLLNDDGVLVAILPVSSKNLPELEGFDYEWGGVYDDAFAGTSVSVILLKITRK